MWRYNISMLHPYFIGERWLHNVAVHNVIVSNFPDLQGMENAEILVY